MNEWSFFSFKKFIKKKIEVDLKLKRYLLREKLIFSIEIVTNIEIEFLNLSNKYLNLIVTSGRVTLTFKKPIKDVMDFLNQEEENADTKKDNNY